MQSLSTLVVREGKMYFIPFYIFRTSSIELKLNVGHSWENSEAVRSPKMKLGSHRQASAVVDNKEPQLVFDLRKGLLRLLSSTHIY